MATNQLCDSGRVVPARRASMPSSVRRGYRTCLRAVVSARRTDMGRAFRIEPGAHSTLHNVCCHHHLSEPVGRIQTLLLPSSSQPLPRWVPGPSTDSPTEMGKPEVPFPWGGRAAQMTQKEGVSTQPRQRSSTVLGTSSFLENLWGFLHAASLPARTEAAWLEREGKCEFPASGQLQIAQLWFPETSPLSIHFCREKKSSWGGAEVGGHGDSSCKEVTSSVALPA